MWYQFLTAGFVHDPSNPLHIVFNMFGLYYFGRPLEERFGKRYFLWFYLTAIVTGFMVYSARAYFLHDPVILHARDGAELRAWGASYGASGGVTAAIVLFCLLYPRTTLLLFFAIPTPAWLVGILVVATDLFGAQSQNTSRVAYDVHLVGAAIAFGTWYFRWNFARWPDGSGLARVLAAPQRWLQSRPALRVHEPGEEYEDLDAEADRLLEKVGREGQGSLTPRERRILEDYSRRIRQKLR
jgi:membrane associated rhomboid family serine protease